MKQIPQPDALCGGRVYEEDGPRSALGALAVEGEPVLADPLLVTLFPAADLDGRVPAAGSAFEVVGESPELDGEFLAPAMTAGRGRMTQSRGLGSWGFPRDGRPGVLASRVRIAGLFERRQGRPSRKADLEAAPGAADVRIPPPPAVPVS